MIALGSRLWPLLCLASLGFSACGSTPENSNSDPRESAVLRGADIELLRSPELDRIAEFQEWRITGEGRLLSLAESGNPIIRRQAVIALGRMPFPEFGVEVTGLLCRLLEDPAVSSLAAHALGLRADPAAARVLQTYFNDADPLLRAAAVAAASRFEDPDLHLELMIALRDADLNVRIEAALGTALWSTKEPRASDIDRALVDTLRPYKVVPGHTTRTAVEAELVWRTLYALGRRQASLGRGPFLQYGDSEIPLERLFALRGLEKLPADAAGIDVATRALVGPTKSSDWRVAHAACAALGAFEDLRALDGLRAAAEHESFHVRAQAMLGLAKLKDPAGVKKALTLVKQGLADVSITVRSAALSASVELVDSSASLRLIDRDAGSENPSVRLGAVEALGRMNSGEQVARLLRLADDPQRQVANRAVELLGGFDLPELRSFLQQRLAHADTGMRLAALEALALHPDASDVPGLMRAFETPKDDISNELSYRVLECLGALKQVEGTQAFLQSALTHREPYLRATAARVLKDDFGLQLAMTHLPYAPKRPELALAGRDFPQWTHNPLVEINTTKGLLHFELFPVEAPQHVANFIKLAERGTYDGLSFHRVVSNFVVQGGDYRGDGNGGMSWQGDSLRHEISPRKYTQGSLGMPRNRDLDSGGGQFFVTHLPTPHLDGRYTIFGELRTGAMVLDALELGDRILGVRLIPN